MKPKKLVHQPRLSCRWLVLTVSFVLLTVLLGLWDWTPQRTVRAATLTVTTTALTGPGSLRDTIQQAASGDTINFNLSGCPCTISLGSVLIDRDLTIQGPGAQLLTITAFVDIFVVRPGGTLRLDGVSIRSGQYSIGLLNNQGTLIVSNSIVAANVSGDTGAKGVFFNQGTLMVSNSIVADNTSAPGKNGQAFFNEGELIISNTKVIDNTSSTSGGGIVSSGTLLIRDSTIANNRCNFGSGGGIRNNQPGTATIINSTIANNVSSGLGFNSFGGGIESGSNNLLTIINSTVTGNSSGDLGGGGISSNGPLYIVNSTIAHNSSSGIGGGIRKFTGATTIINSLIAGNLRSGVPNDLDGTNSVNNHHNLVGDTATAGGMTNGVNGNIVGVAVNTVLDTILADNGGPTQTLKLLTNSPAINAGAHVTTLSGALDNTSTSLTLADASAFPGGIGFVLRLDNEQMIVTARTGNQLTVTRAANGTTAAPHNDGAGVNPAFDQRGAGFRRSSGGIVDIGAFEASAASTPTLAVAKSHTGNFTQGQTGVFTIQVTNQGSDATTEATTVSDTLPTGYTLSSFSGADWTCTGTSTVTCTSPQAISGAGSGSGGAFPVLTLTVNVPSNSPTSVTNIARVFGGGDPVHTNVSNAAIDDDTVTVLQVAAALKVTGGATQSATVNTAFAQPLAVTVCDAADVGIPGVTVTFSAPSSGASASLTTPATTNSSGGTSVTATANVIAGGPYTVTAQSGSLSVNFSLTNTPGAAAQLAFVQQPSNTVVNQTIAPAVTVRLTDSFGNLTNSTANVALALGANPGSATLGGTTTVAAVNGLATFSNLSLNQSGNGYTLTASSSSLMGTSSAFNVTPLTPVITWNPPAAIGVGVPLSTTQLNATGNVDGAFTYSPPAGTMFNAGTYTLTANFTPTNTAAYQSASKTVTLTVNANACGLDVRPLTMPTATRGVQFGQTLWGAPTGSYTFSLASGTLPPGVTLVHPLGIYSLRGKPTTTGTYTFTIKGKLSNSTCEGVRVYTVTVQ